MTALYEKGDSALPEFVQFFEIQNTGPSDILASQFKISLRSKTDKGDTVMRLRSEPEVTSGEASCHQSLDSSDSRYIVIDCTTERLSSHENSNKIVVRIPSALGGDAIAKVGASFAT